jgi:hypothetical protein
MRKFKTIFKVLTFINIEIVVMVLFMLGTILFGINYTNNAIDYTKRLTDQIKENSELTVKLSDNINQFNLIDNILLSKSLKGENISLNVENYVTYRDSFMLNKYEYLKVDSLLSVKKDLLYRIYLSKKKDNLINYDDFEEVDYIPFIVERKELNIKKKGLFKKSKVDTTLVKDTIYKEFKKLNTLKILDAQEKFKKMIDSEIENAIYYNNSLSYQIRHLLNFKISIINKRNIKIQDSLIEELRSQFVKYVITMCFILVVFVFISILLIYDIRKKSKKEYRQRYLISLLLNKK